jgi:acetylornithine deacetylase/succinyl-diaminopimelate desuccinylase family protein
MIVENVVRALVLDKIDEMREEIVKCCSDLVKIQSVNPLYPGVAATNVLGGEKRCNEFLMPVLEGFGCKTDMFEKAAQRTNLVGVLKGSGGGRSLIFNGHIDTVPLGRREDWKWKDPLSGKVEDGKIYGRGACDMKSGIVGMIKAIEAITRTEYRLKGDMTIESVVGEEVMSSGLGVEAAIERGYKADAAIVSEATAPPIRLAVAPVSPGVCWMSVTVDGKPVHTSVRDELIRAGGRGSEVGVNAVEKGVKILQALQELEQQWGIEKRHPLFNPGHFTIHPGVIEGGPFGVMVPFIVSEFCTIQYAIWHHPEQSLESVKREIEDYVKGVARLDPWLREHPPRFEWKLWWPPYNVSVDHPICKTVAAAHEAATGNKAQFHGYPCVCDATFFNRHGIPAIAYGPGDLITGHASNEYVEIQELISATKTYALAALDWCGYMKK